MKKFSSFMDEPHEKLYINIVSILLFSVIYYKIYLSDRESFVINKDTLKNKTNGELTYTDFLYFAVLLNFTVAFGDIIPSSNTVKLLANIQVVSFWGITLF
jgi:hypothetical protein|tara:strand:+ start:701 stop:1003 length:303 start_codon:yes stop_codon:yes gene_type:complete